MLPFDRLFHIVDTAMDDGIITDDVFGQIGNSAYMPRNFPYTRFMPSDDFEAHIQSADLVIGHAGIGTIMQALDNQKPLMVLARLASRKEHVNDHQVPTARRFAQLGHLLSFDDSNFSEVFRLIREFKPKPRHANVEGVADRIGSFLHAERQRLGRS